MSELKLSDEEKKNKKITKKVNIIKSKKIKQEKDKLKMIDLFAGTGAFSYAFEKTGIVECVFSNDTAKWSKQIYDLNFNHKLTLGNICDIDVKNIPSHNILSAGFPCQPFSIAGKQMGFDDVRSNVFWKILEIAKHHKPRCIILENVKNLSTHDNGDTLKTIITSLEKEKYHIIYKVLNTSDITTIPQHRERIYIVCVKDKKIFDKFNLNFNSVIKNKITNMLSDKIIDDKYYYNNKPYDINNIDELFECQNARYLNKCDMKFKLITFEEFKNYIN